MEVVSIKFYESDLKALKNAAFREGVSVSEFIRRGAMRRVKKSDYASIKENENEKENIPPTPPIREKEKEKENSLARACARACERKPEEAKPKPKEPFVKPTIDELRAYMAEKGYHFDAQCFMDFYETNGWRVKNKPMKSWQHVCATWESFRRDRVTSRTSRIEAQRKLVELPPDAIPANALDELFADERK